MQTVAVVQIFVQSKKRFSTISSEVMVGKRATIGEFVLLAPTKRVARVSATFVDVQFTITITNG